MHNLKNIDISIPKNKLVVITGISGSGKSSLAFDTIYAEGQRRYMETFGAYARQFIGDMERPDVDKITGLSPVISIEQKTTNKNPRSTVGTVTEIYDFLRLLYARIGEAYSYNTRKRMVKWSEEEIVDNIFKNTKGRKLLCWPHWSGEERDITGSCLKKCGRKVFESENRWRDKRPCSKNAGRPVCYPRYRTGDGQAAGYRGT